MYHIYNSPKNIILVFHIYITFLNCIFNVNVVNVNVEINGSILEDSSIKLGQYFGGL